MNWQPFMNSGYAKGTNLKWFLISSCAQANDVIYVPGYDTSGSRSKKKESFSLECSIKNSNVEIIYIFEPATQAAPVCFISFVV